MPKKVIPLGELQIKNAKPCDGAYKLFDGGGLYLEVLPTGGKSWRWKYTFGGVEGTLRFGLWPDVSLKQARALRDEYRALSKQGVNPKKKQGESKALERASAREATSTFEAVARDWHSQQSRLWGADHAKRTWGRIKGHLLPSLGDIQVSEVSAKDLLAVFRDLEAEGKHETVHRLRGYADNIFAYAIASQLAESNPAAAIAKALAPSVTVHRAAIVDQDGVGRLMRSIWGYLGSPLVRGCLQITALTAARPGEARRMEWEEISFDGPYGPMWNIPASKTKLRRDHMIPLAPHVVSILEGLSDLTGHDQYVFPNSRKANQPMSDMAMNMALRKMGYGADVHVAHGFRSTFSTLAREHGWQHHLIEASLAHLQGNSVSQAYDRAQYIAERRTLLEWWAGYLEGLKTGARVTPIRKRASG